MKSHEMSSFIFNEKWKTNLNMSDAAVMTGNYGKMLEFQKRAKVIFLLFFLFLNDLYLSELYYVDYKFRLMMYFIEPAWYLP